MTMRQGRTLIYGLLVAPVVALAIGCSSLNKIDRYPSAAGQDGEAGAAGSRGQDGQSGHGMLIVNCDGYIASAPLLTKHVNHLDEDFQDMCPPTATPDPRVLAKAIAALDLKIKNLSNSGFFKSQDITTASGLGQENSLSHLKARMLAANRLQTQIQARSQISFGCRQGSVHMTQAPPGPYQICFNAELTDIGDDGVVDIRLRMEAFRLLADGKPNSTPHFSERSSLAALPVVCAKGTPLFTASSTGTSNGQAFTQNTRSTCEKFEVNYSAIYPTLEIRYQE